MTGRARFALILGGLIVGGAYAAFFDMAADLFEPWEHDFTDALIAVSFAVLLMSPVWLAAAVPARYQVTLGILRWLGILALMPALLLGLDAVGSFVRCAVASCRPLPESHTWDLVALLVLASAAVCTVLLARPDIERLRGWPRSSNAADDAVRCDH